MSKNLYDPNENVARDIAIEKIVNAWNSKNAKAAKRIGTFGFMAATLTACGGGGSSKDPAVEPQLSILLQDDKALIAGVSGAFAFLTAGSSNSIDQVTGVDLNTVDANANGKLLEDGAPTLAESPQSVSGVTDLVIGAGVTLVARASDINSADSAFVKISGKGNLWILVEADETVTLNIDLDGGRLTLDMPSDAVTLTLAPATQLNLGGGVLVVSDGVLDARNVELENINDISGVVLNSKLVLNADQFIALEVVPAGAGALEIIVEDQDQAIRLVKYLTENDAVLSADLKVEIQPLSQLSAAVISASEVFENVTVIDTVVPSAPVISQVAGNDVVNFSEAESAITGTAETNALVSLTLGAGNVRTVEADGNGAWTYTLVNADITAMGQGAETISATAKDAAGNVSAPGFRDITIDTVAPTTTLTIDSITTDSGAADFITNDNDGLTINATLSTGLATGEILQYSTDNVNWTDITGSVSGTAVVHTDTGLTSTATVYMRVNDTDTGNNGTSASQLVTIDTTAPTTTLTIDSITTDSGAADFITNDNDGLTINATLSTGLATGEILQYSTDNVNWTDITGSVSGTAVVHTDTGLTSTATVYMRVNDTDTGNNGTSASQLVTIDTTAPTTTLTIDSITTDSGAADFITNDNDGLTINATLSTGLATGEILQYSTDNVNWTDITGSVSGTAVVHTDTGLTSTATVYMRVNDTDTGNNGTSASQLVTIDTTAPTTTLTIDSITTDSGAADFITNDNDGLTINATLSTGLATGEILQYSTDNVNWTDITGSVSGTAVVHTDTGLTSTATVYMRVLDGAGQNGTSASQLVTIDTAAPTTTLTIDSITTDSGAADFITNDNDGLTINATLSTGLATGEILQYSTDNVNWTDITGSVSGTAVVHTDTGLTSTATVYMRVNDTDTGNNGTSASQLVTIDTTAPTTTLTIDSITTDSGAADFITNDNDGLTINATLSTGLATGEILQYSTDNVNWTDITGSVSGTAVVHTDTGLTSTATVYMRVNDTDTGNNGTSASQLVTIDTTAPTTTLTIDSITTDSGAADFITNDNDGLTINATLSTGLATGEILQYSTDNVNWTDITGSVSGTAVVHTDTGLTSTATVYMRVNDTDTGNNGTSASQLVTIDTTAPTTTLTIDSITTDSGAADFITNDNDGLTINATLSTGLATGEILQYSTDNVNWTDITGSVSGTAVVHTDTGLTSTATVYMRVNDTDTGNNGTSASQLVTIDTTAPTTTLTIDSITTDSGAADFITNDNDGLTINATLSTGLATGEILQYSTDNVNWTDITGSVSGTAVVHTDTGLTSTATVYMRVLDGAGQNGTSASQLVTIDTVAPTTTLTIDSITTDSGAADFITNDNDGLTINATLSTGLATGEILQYSTDNVNWTDITGSVSGTAVVHTDTGLTSTATVYMRVNDTDTGNNGTSASQLVTIDTTAPTTTLTIDSITTDSGAADFITNDNDGLTINATLSTGLATGEILQYSTDNVNWTDITGSVSGTAVVHTDTGLTSTATVYMRVLDGAGQNGTSASQLVTIDTTAPTTTLTIDSITTDSGAADFITNDNDGLTINATLSTGLATGEILQYSTDNVNWTDITGSVSGTAVVHTDTGLTSTATVYMRVLDGAGQNGTSASQLVTIDTVAPTTTLTIDSITTDSGAADFITNDNDGLTINATLSTGLATGEILQYSTDNVNWTDITGSVSGTAVVHTDTGLTSTATVYMRVNDTDTGNNGTSASQLVTIDTTAPTTTLTIDSITTDSGAADFITNDNDGLTINATLSTGLATGEILQYSTDNVNWTDITGSVSGTAVVHTDTGLTSTATVYMRVLDGAGQNGTSASQLVTIDTVAPTTTLTIDSITTDSGAADFITNDNDGLTINATLSTGLATGEILQYSTDNVNWTDITGSVSGTAVVHTDTGLTSTATVYMRVNDTDTGNNGTSASQLVTIDTTAPTTTLTIDSITTDSGAADFITNDNDGLTINATLSTGLATGEILQYSTDNVNWTDITGSVSGTAVVHTDTGLTSTATVYMRVNDTDTGNNGTSASQLVTIDTTAPTTTLTIDSITTDSGAADFITNDNDGLTINATLSTGLATGEILQYSTDNVNWTDITGSVSGTAVVHTDTGLTSTATVYMRVLDGAGQNGTSASQLVTIDTTAPTTTLTIDSITTDSGAADFITNDNDGLTINATLSTGLATGEILQYSTDNVNWTDITGSVSGTAVVHTDTGLTSTATVYMRVNDTDTGNNGTSASQLVTIDTTAPTTTLTIDSITTDSGAADFITNDNDGLTINATLSTGLATGEILQYSTDNVNWTDITGSVSGTAVVHTDTGLTSTATVYMRVLDGAGQNGTSASQLVTIDTTAPTTTLTIDSITTDSGAADFITNDNDGLTINATLSTGLATGEILQYSTDNVNWTDITGSVSGTAVVHTDTGLTSTATVYMRVLDGAGQNGTSASQLVTIDTAAEVPIISAMAHANSLDMDFLRLLEVSTDEVLISGTAEIGASVNVTISDRISEITLEARNVSGSWLLKASDFGAEVLNRVVSFNDSQSRITLADNEAYTVSIHTTDIAGNSASVSTLLTVDTPPFEVVDNGDGTVTLDGTAEGILKIDVDVAGTATLTRLDANGVEQPADGGTTIAGFYGKQLVGAVDGLGAHTIEINVNGGDFRSDSEFNPNIASEDVRYVIIDAPDARLLQITGDLGTAVERNAVIVRVADANVGVRDTTLVKVDTSALQNIGANDVFEIELLETSRNDFQLTDTGDDGTGEAGVDKDTVAFDRETSIAGFGLYQTQNGEVVSVDGLANGWSVFDLDSEGNIQWTGAPFSSAPVVKYFAGTQLSLDKFPVFSTLNAGLEDLKVTSQLMNLFDSATLKINIYEGEQTALVDFLETTSLKIVGYNVIVQVLTWNGSGFDAAALNLTAHPDISSAIDAISYDGLVKTAAKIEALVLDVASNDQGILSLVERAADLEAAVTTLKGDATTDGSVAKSISDAVTSLQLSIDGLFDLIGPNAPAVSIDSDTGEITVSVSDSDVTGIKIYEGSTDVTSTYFETPAIDTSADPYVYVFTPKAGVELDAAALTVKAVVTVGTGSDARSFESIAGTVVSYSFDNVAPSAPSVSVNALGVARSDRPRGRCGVGIHA